MKKTSHRPGDAQMQLVAQSILSEMETCIKDHQQYYSHLPRPIPGVTHLDYIVTEETHHEATMNTWRAAMEIVARQTHIKIVW